MNYSKIYTEEENLLIKRVRQAIEQSVRRETLFDFLSEREQCIALDILRQGGAEYLFFGGWPPAERKRLFVLPQYLEKSGVEAYDDQMLEEVFDLCVLFIEGSSYRALSHRDYLGSVLSLGIKRGKIGDIILCSDFCAYLICDCKIAQLIISEAEKECFRVANDRVRVRRTPLPRDCAALVKTEKISDTVPSARLDAVVSALIGKPREFAKSLIERGLVSCSGFLLEKPDMKVGEGDRLSVRGWGRFQILRLSETTKKGRLRLQAEKFV